MRRLLKRENTDAPDRLSGMVMNGGDGQGIESLGEEGDEVD